MLKNKRRERNILKKESISGMSVNDILGEMQIGDYVYVVNLNACYYTSDIIKKYKIIGAGMRYRFTTSEKAEPYFEMLRENVTVRNGESFFETYFKSSEMDKAIFKTKEEALSYYTQYLEREQNETVKAAIKKAEKTKTDSLDFFLKYLDKLD